MPTNRIRHNLDYFLLKWQQCFEIFLNHSLKNGLLPIVATVTVNSTALLTVLQSLQYYIVYSTTLFTVLQLLQYCSVSSIRFLQYYMVYSSEPRFYSVSARKSLFTRAAICNLRSWFSFKRRNANLSRLVCKFRVCHSALG